MYEQTHVQARIQNVSIQKNKHHFPANSPSSVLFKTNI